MNKYYVYVHSTLDGIPFYVGKGCGNRAFRKDGRSSKWVEFSSKGYSVDLIFENLTEDESLTEEESAIKELLYFGYPLVNVLYRGSKSNMSDEARRKISITHKGRQKSEQERLNISLAQKGRKPKQSSIENMRKSLTGKKQSEETKRKRSETLKRVGTTNDRATYLFYSKDGEVFVGTRAALAEKENCSPRKFRTLFQEKPSSFANNWGVLTPLKLLFLKEIYNAYNCTRRFSQE